MAVAADPVVDELRVLASQNPALAELAVIYEVLLPALANADLHVCPVDLTAQQAREKLENGKPLLEDISLEFDGYAATNLLIDLARAIENAKPSPGTAKWSTWILGHWRQKPRASALDRKTGYAAVRANEARQIRLELENGDLNAARVVASAAAGERSSVAALAEDLELDAALLWTLAQHALRPALNACRPQMSALVAGTTWEKGFCLICGADPTLGELQGNEGALHLRCGLCGADWRMSRTACVFCGNDDPNSLRVLFPEGQRDKWHVRACQVCHRYLKVVSSFDRAPAEALVVWDLATLPLDLIAQEHAYLRKEGEDRVYLK